MSQAHRAVVENPAYFTMLQDLSSVAEELVAPPITDQELEAWHSMQIGLASMNELEFARGGRYLLERPENADMVRPFERRVLDASYFDTFRDDELDHRILIRRLREELSTAGVPDAIRSTENVLTYIDKDPAATKEYARFLPDWPRAIAYSGALRIITQRLRSDGARLSATLALGDDTQHELLVRVHKRRGDMPPKRAALDAFVEGHDSIAFAGAHLELGGAQLADNQKRFAHAILGYTALIPESGMLAPMALRGEYFRDLTDIEGNIQPAYRQVFDAAWRRRQENKPGPIPDEPEVLPVGPPYDLEYCNAVGFPSAPEVDYTPEYQGEGCPARYRRIVYGHALLFAAKLQELQSTGVTPPTAHVFDFAPIAGTLRSIHARMR